MQSNAMLFVSMERARHVLWGDGPGSSSVFTPSLCITTYLLISPTLCLSIAGTRRKRRRVTGEKVGIINSEERASVVVLNEMEAQMFQVKLNNGER